MQSRNHFRNVKMKLQQHMTEGCKTLHHVRSYSSPDIILVMKSMMMRLAGNVSCMSANRNAYTGF